MDTSFWISLVAFGVVASFPFHRFWPWLANKLRQTHLQLDVPKPQIWFSNAWVPVVLVHLSNFFKSFGILWIMNAQFGLDDTLTAILIAWIGILYIWSPFYSKQQDGWFFFLLGFYLFASHSWGWLFIPIFGLSVLTLNSVYLGTCVSCVLVWQAMGVLDTGTSSVQLTAHLAVIAVVAISSIGRIFTHLETGNDKLFERFKRRLQKH